jgi:Cysteine-rich CPXCG
MEPATPATVTAARAAMIESTTITCPYCWESIEIELDLSVDGQRYVEDCSVCCRPIVIAYRVEDGALASLAANAENDA